MGFLRRRTSPDQRERASVTVNARVRNARGLISKKLRRHLREKIELPESFLRAFDEFEREREPSLRYRSKIDAESLVRTALAELSPPRQPGETERDFRRRREAHKALLLCLVSGLRRSEADWILWRSFDPDRHQIHVEATEFHRLKSAESTRVIDLPPSVSSFFQEERSHTPGAFILTGKDNPSRLSRCYRANPTFRFLTIWLKANGVADRKPIHVLRKEIGSLIASKQGIFAASRYLGHSGIQITGQIYADQKTSVFAPISALSAPETT